MSHETVLTLLGGAILAVLVVQTVYLLWPMSSGDGQPTTESPTKASSSAAAPLVWDQMTLVDRVLLVAGMVKDAAMGSITPTTQASLQSDQPVTGSGPAEPDSECVHFMMSLPLEDWPIESEPVALPGLRRATYCSKCLAVFSYGKTVVPAAAPSPLTSAKQGSTPSAPAPEAAPSASSGSVATSCEGGHFFPPMSFSCYCRETTRSWL